MADVKWLIYRLEQMAQTPLNYDAELIRETIAALSHAAGQEVKCWCETCRPITPMDCRMVLCPTCGNKRCPHATYHGNACTGSNEPGQKGSSYEHCAPAVARSEGEAKLLHGDDYPTRADEARAEWKKG